MRNLLIVSLVGVSSFLTGCAQSNGAGFPTGSTASGRFLQVAHPINGVIGLQLVLPTAQGCAYFLRNMQSDASMRELASTTGCTEKSASEHLPFSATVRNKPYNFLVDVESIDLRSCEQMLEGIMNAPEKENLQLVAKCARK